MALMMLLGTSSAWGAQYNLNWQGKVYFLVPETWDISAYSYVQVDITRTTTATNSNYQFYAGKMTRIGTSRLFYLKLSADHSGWGQNEYITFTANDHEYNSGTFNINGNHYYATPLDYGCNNSSNYYLFKPSTESQFTTTTNGNTLTANYNSSRDNVLKADQTVNIYTNGSSSADGGSVSLKGYYFTSDTGITSSTANSSGASGKYGAVIGSEMTLTASAKTGYEFDGWYNASSGGTLLSSSATYTYNVYGTKTIYARFTQSCTPPDAPFEGVAQSEDICTGSTYTFNSDYKWYTTLNGSTTVSGSATINAETTYYIAKEGSDGCESPRTTYTINVNSIPSFSKYPTNKSICEGDSEDNLTTLSGVAVNNGSSVWYNAQTGGSKVNTADVVNGGTYWVAAENATTGCKNDTRKQFVLTVNPRPAAPTFDEIPAKCGSYTLPAEDKNQVNVNWYTAATGGEKITSSVTTTSTYHAEAVDGTCTSAERTPVQITINTIPTISISSENNSAVLYEDVTLTATGSDIDEVNWTITSGTGTLSNTTGTSVKLTSSTAGTVKVKATATSENDCTKESNELSVIFANETCNNVADMTKIYFDATENTGFVTGSNVYVTITKSTNGSADCNDTGGANQGSYVPKNDTWWGTMTKVAGENYIYEITIPNNVTINKGTTKLSFWNNSISGNSDVWEVQAILGQTISAGTNCMKLSNKTKTHNDDRHSHLYCGTWTTYKNAPAISAPAAKTISVSTTDGEGNIIFSGQVVKTGCDATNEYGFQYSSDEQTWTTVKVGENAAAGTAISNNTVNGLDGTYYVRAYITNDNSTQYGAIKAITVSTEKEPITTVTLTHVRNQAGESYSDQELANLTYCVGDEVWFELNYVGSKFIPENNVGYKWTTCPGNGLIGPYNGNKYKFTITSSGTIGISLRNEENVDLEGNPTWVESNLLKFNTHPEPTAPTISFATATICSNDDVGATLTLSATVSGQEYELWKYANDDDTEGSKVANVATLNCTENNQALQFSGIKTAGKYFVKTYYTAFCNTVIANSTHATLTVVNANDVYISISPATATTTPWMPVKLTVAASDDYTLEVPEGVEFNQNGNICSVKIPLPEDSTLPAGTTPVYGQYENVVFPQDATTSYTVTAKLVSTGGEDNPCAVPATATITLTPYVEDCTIGH